MELDPIFMLIVRRHIYMETQAFAQVTLRDVYLHAKKKKRNIHMYDKCRLENKNNYDTIPT